jgi:small ligand-binding sensory domain FIST
MPIATGLSAGPDATADLVTLAVNEAMERAALDHVSSILLFLSADFAAAPQPALLAAAKAAACTQIVGCTAAGIFTENDWVLDSPAAAAMVFGDGIRLETVREAAEDDLILSLASPNCLNAAWLMQPGHRFGGISGDASGQGPYKVWSGGKLTEKGRSETCLRGAQGAVGISQGALPLCPPKRVTELRNNDVLALEGQSALASLELCLPPEMSTRTRIPLHLLMAGITLDESATAIGEGRYRLVPIVSANDDGSVTLSVYPEEGQSLFWALREPSAAERDMRLMLSQLGPRLEREPDFALVFPCMGRSPYFYGGVDRDLETLKKEYPDMPFIGFYGNGEIAPFNRGNELFQYSTVLGLFHV